MMKFLLVLFFTFVSHSFAQEKTGVSIIKFPQANISMLIKVSGMLGSPVIIGPEELKPTVIRGFKNPETLKKEALLFDFDLSTSDQRKTPASVVKEDFKWGRVYTLSTLSSGSISYSYICRKNEKDCLRIGPYTMIRLDWKNVQFKKMEK